MKKALSMILVLVLLLSIPVMACAATAVPNSVIQATESVVRIISEYRYDVGSGSGFVVKSSRSETLIATNYHVVEGYRSIYVVSREGELLDAHIVCCDKNRDICILSLDTPLPMKPLRFDTKPRQGEAVYAVGFPAASDAFSDQFAFKSEEATITDGIVSSLRQFTVDGKGGTVSALQISAAINPGNSGGPLLNAKGQVLGIDTWGIEDSQGIFGAVAVSELAKLAKDNGIRLGGTGLPGWVLIAALVVLALAVLLVVLIRRSERKAAGTGAEPARARRVKTLTLSEYIDRLGRPLLPQEAVSLLMPAIVQLKELHNKGRPHLQLTPDSIEIDKKGARLRALKAGEANYYTVGYAAPELCRGKNYGVFSDIYSMCAVLLYAVTGDNPAIDPDKVPGAEEKARAAKPDGEFLALLERGMAAEYAERYGSVQELIFVLSPYNFPISIAREAFCGEAAAKPAAPREKRKRVREPRKPWTTGKKAVCALLIVLVLILGCAGGYYGCYRRACVLADKGNFSEAQDLLFLPAVTRLHDEEIFSYIDAGLLLEQGDYVNALKYFKNDALKGYRDTEAQIEKLTEAVYQEGIEQYRAGEYSDARNCFQSVGSYKDSEKYVTLAKCRSYFNGTLYKELLKIIDFEDAKEVLVLDDNLACRFLEGSWRSSDGYYFFTMGIDYRIQYNLPYIDLEESTYSFSNGFLILVDINNMSSVEKYEMMIEKAKGGTYYESAPERGTKCFKFTVETEDRISVYCYKDGSTYTLYRQ